MLSGSAWAEVGSVNAGEELCLACGMCCDGTLFDNVRLGADEDAAAVKALGLPVRFSRAKVPVAFFRQPCRALGADCTCSVYANRPAQCRSFECGVFKAAESGDIGYESAHRLVKQARKRAERARKLLRKMGERDEGLSLGARFRRVQRWVESGEVDAAAGETFAALGLAMHQLDLLAHRKFYTEEEV
ncbi:YkgJ family cysteine cluster protein [Pelagicoccus sp. SDUM812005]|uniref:YkgJ family cysteine cluster protein n=1 Tax=Pelagicoccus sp. SDUM812005 TaxID=3041257 RepID=UPI00280FAD32|nr:YkgJ family cysteine cluster protein [Pelagicoccus sp. SDUM812005]MDQ8180052.1 YkgJ family cysteine cluster protein [Pelagicoccus sp. SDUM812005]